MSETTSIQIPKDLHRELKITAAKRGTTLTALIIEAVKAFLSKK
jgi:hypothetical protein